MTFAAGVANGSRWAIVVRADVADPSRDSPSVRSAAIRTGGRGQPRSTSWKKTRARVRSCGRAFRQGLEGLMANKIVGEVRGMGLMQGMER
jgi:hypothetical protein